MRLLDLSHPLEHGQLNFPFDPNSVLVHNTIRSIGYNITELSLSTYQGTHLDAPYHFFDDGKTLDQMGLDLFYGPATLVEDSADPGTLRSPRQRRSSRRPRDLPDRVGPLVRPARVLFRFSEAHPGGGTLVGIPANQPARYGHPHPQFRLDGVPPHFIEKRGGDRHRRGTQKPASLAG